MWEAYKIYYRDDDSYVRAYLGDELIWQKLVNNVIYYTSTDNQVVTPYYNSWGSGVTMLSNTYADGRGVMVFDNDVTRIGDNVFYNCSTLSSIIIPDSVTRIGNAAFQNCTSLTSIHIPPFVNVIQRSFIGCTSLTSITVDPDNHTYDSRNNCNAIINTSTNELTDGCSSTVIPDDVTSIDDTAFYGHSGLISINIPDSVLEIGNQTFRQTGLTSVFIPDSVTTINNQAFIGCRSLSTVIFESSTVPTVGTSIFNTNAEGRKIYVPAISLQDYKSNANLNRYEADIYPYGGILFYKSTDNQVVTPYDSTVFGANILENIYTKTGGVIIFDGPVTSIDNSAFNGCTNLAEIEIPASVTSIGNNAFNGCSGLTSINIPASVTSIGNNAFNGCSGLTSITVDANNTTYDSRNNCNAIIRTSTNNLRVGCENTVIPSSVTTIGDYAFYGRNMSNGITIPSSVTTIGVSSFQNVTGMTSITIPTSVTSIGNNAFNGCTDLSEVIFEGTTPPSTVGSNIFENNAPGRLIYVPNSALQAYKTAFSQYEAYIVGYGPTPSYIMLYKSTNGQVVTPYNSANFGANLISNTYTNGQGTMTFDGPVTKIGLNSFKECTTLKNITIPDTVSSIGSYAFDGCRGLTSINIPASVTSISNNSYTRCYKLASITVDANNTYYDSRNNCNAIISTSTNKLVTGCKNTVIPNTVTTIGDYAFYGNLDDMDPKDILISSSVRTIGNYAFAHNAALMRIIIPSSVTSINNYAFNNCSTLITIFIGTTPPTVPTGGGMIFSPTSGTISNNPIYVPMSALQTYKTIFSNFVSRIVGYGSIIYYTSTDNNMITPSYNLWGSVNLIYNKYYNQGKGIMLFDGTLTEIGNQVFINKSKLNTVIIPETVTKIGHKTFYNSSLSSITIPASVTNIVGMTFDNCRYLSEVIVMPTEPPFIGETGQSDYPTIFDNNAAGRLIKVPSAQLYAYKNAGGWRRYSSDIVSQ